MIAHIHKSGQTSWDKFVPSQETNYVVYHFLSVLKFWLNLFKTMPEWLLPWSIGQWPNRDNNEDQNSYLLFIRIWRLVAFPLWVSCWMAVIQITSQIYDNPHILAMLPLVQSCCLSLLIFNNKWFINWMSGFFLIVAAFSAIKKCSAYHFKKRGNLLAGHFSWRSSAPVTSGMFLLPIYKVQGIQMPYWYPHCLPLCTLGFLLASLVVFVS